MNNKLFLTLFFAFTLSLNVFADKPGEEVVEAPVAAEESTETDSSSDDSSSDDAPAPVTTSEVDEAVFAYLCSLFWVIFGNILIIRAVRVT